MQKFRPHFSYLDGYTFPIVAAALDTLEPPPPLRQIPQLYLGDLRVSLAHELSVVLKMAVYEMRQNAIKQRRRSAAVEACMDRRYHTASVRHRECFRRERDAFNALLDFERNAYHSGRATTVTGEGERAEPRSPINDWFAWRTGIPWMTEKECALLKEQHSRLVKRYLPTVPALQRSEKRIEVERRRFLESHNYQKRIHELEESTPVFQLGIAGQYQLTGAAYYLKNLYYDWWAAFDEIVTKAVRQTLARGIHRIALRDPNVVMRIEESPMADNNWDDAAERIFKDSTNDWGVAPVSSDTIKQMRSRLRAEDRKTAIWITKNGGARHPCNIYYLWAHQHKVSALTQISDGECAAGETVSTNIKEALNDLCWCLSREEFEHVSFKPLTSQRYSKTDWEAHRIKWWAEIERAREAARPK